MRLFIKLFLGIVALLIIAVVALVLIIDPNDYKEQIQAQVKQTINRDLSINGDISWSFYPQLGFDFGEVELNNPVGFNRKNLIKIDNAAVGVAVLPLVKGEIQIGELTLNGLIVNLITNKDGTSNLDNMTSTQEAQSAEQPDSSTSEEAQPTSFDASKLKLAGINIENVQIEVQDLQVDSVTKLDIKHIHLGRFTPGEQTDLSIETDLLVADITGQVDLKSKLVVSPDLASLQLTSLILETVFTGNALPNGKINSTINANITYNLNNSLADIKDFSLLVDQIRLAGELSLQTQNKTKVRFTLEGNEWDLNPYMVSENTPTEKTNNSVTATAESSTKQETAPSQEPDLTFLEDLDIQGKLTIAGIKAAELKIGEVNSTIKVNQGKAQITPLTAQLYEGLLTLNASVDGAKGKNSYQVDSKLESVQIHQLLIDAAQIDLLSGTTAFNLSATGKGLTLDKIKSGLQGNGDFTLLDGELYGINLSQELRTFKAKLKGEPAPTEADIKKTDFASLTGQFSIKEGTVDNSKLLMLSPVMRLDGTGLANILSESLDYKLGITPLSKSDSQTDLQDLSGVTIPLLIKGPFTAPKFSLDTEGALKTQLAAKAKEKLEAEKQRVQEKLEAEKQRLKEKSQEKIDEKSKELEEKLKSKLSDLFN